MKKPKLAKKLTRREVGLVTAARLRERAVCQRAHDAHRFIVKFCGRVVVDVTLKQARNLQILRGDSDARGTTLIELGGAAK
jgi:hypothetical protein